MAASTAALRIPLLASVLALAACGDDGRAPARSTAAGDGAPAHAAEGRLELLAVAGSVPDSALAEFANDSGCEVSSRFAAHAKKLQDSLLRASQAAGEEE